ncbi:MAG: hypothetical protein HRU19_32250 [Pseudobacteriovorax sp.]|nr:hypothetical protein [Pseudobacteriovorax sp.]
MNSGNLFIKLIFLYLLLSPSICLGNGVLSLDISKSDSVKSLAKLSKLDTSSLKSSEMSEMCASLQSNWDEYLSLFKNNKDLRSFAFISTRNLLRILGRNCDMALKDLHQYFLDIFKLNRRLATQLSEWQQIVNILPSKLIDGEHKSIRPSRILETATIEFGRQIFHKHCPIAKVFPEKDHCFPFWLMEIQHKKSSNYQENLSDRRTAFQILKTHSQIITHWPILFETNARDFPSLFIEFEDPQLYSILSSESSVISKTSYSEMAKSISCKKLQEFFKTFSPTLGKNTDARLLISYLIIARHSCQGELIKKTDGLDSRTTRRIFYKNSSGAIQTELTTPVTPQWIYRRGCTSSSTRHKFSPQTKRARQLDRYRGAGKSESCLN